MSNSSFHSAHSTPTHCYCGVPVAKKTSWTSTNPGRRFVVCKVYCPERGVEGCGFFDWVDADMVEWQRVLTNQLLLEKKLLEKEKELLKIQVCNVEDQKANLVRDLDNIKLKYKNLLTDKKLKGKKKQGSNWVLWWLLLLW